MSVVSPKLIKQQKTILNSTENKIIVIAGPGSGKTHTLTNKIKKDLDKGEKGVIAISFTKESANQLKRKLSKELDEHVFEKSFIGTIDSFLIELLNVGYSHVHKKKKPDFQYFFLEQNDPRERNYLKCSKENIYWREYYTWWKNQLESGRYYFSYNAFAYGQKLLSSNKVIDYIKFKYSHIYIDEAQDLNKWQYFFFNKMIDKCELNACFVGDDKQCIYGFRGSDSSLFSSLPEHGYTKFEITESVRCPESILKLSLAYYHNENEKIVLDDKIIINPKVIEIQAQSCLFLASTGTECLAIIDKLEKQKITNVKYIKEVELPNNLYINEEKFNALMYFLVNSILAISEYENRKLLSSLYNDVIEYDFTTPIDKILSARTKNEAATIIKDEFELPDTKINELIEDIHFNYYDLNQNINRVMTIHKSKGLEANHIYLKLGDDFASKSNEERCKYFVAMTRAKSKLFISARANSLNELHKYIICS